MNKIVVFIPFTHDGERLKFYAHKSGWFYVVKTFAGLLLVVEAGSAHAVHVALLVLALITCIAIRLALRCSLPYTCLPPPCSCRYLRALACFTTMIHTSESCLDSRLKFVAFVPRSFTFHACCLRGLPATLSTLFFLFLFPTLPSLLCVVTVGG